MSPAELLWAALEFALKGLPDVAKALGGAADRGEFPADVAEKVRSILPAVGASEAVEAEIRAAMGAGPSER